MLSQADRAIPLRFKFVKMLADTMQGRDSTGNKVMDLQLRSHKLVRRLAWSNRRRKVGLFLAVVFLCSKKKNAIFKNHNFGDIVSV